MIFQTQPDDENNRGINKRTNLKTEICFLWLGRQSLVKTFDEDSLNINDADEDIKDIRLLLDQDDAASQV